MTQKDEFSPTHDPPKPKTGLPLSRPFDEPACTLPRTTSSWQREDPMSPDSSGPMSWDDAVWEVFLPDDEPIDPLPSGMTSSEYAGVRSGFTGTPPEV